MKIRFRRELLFLILSFVLLACGTEENAPTRSPMSSSTAVEALLEVEELELDELDDLAPPPQRTLNPQSTAVNVVPIAVQQPSHSQLDSYLQFFLETTEGPPFPPLNLREVHYRDLNGDGLDELIVDGTSYVAVMLWQGELYSEPFVFDIVESLNQRTWLSNSIVEFEDWTNDGNEEIIFKVRTKFSATPYGASIASYRIINCDLETCRLALQIDNSRYFEDIINGGEGLEQTAYTLFVNEEGEAAVRTLTTGHRFNCCGGFESGPNPELTQEEWLERIRSFHVAESIARTYIWNGEVFELSVEEIAALGYTLAPTSRFEANSKKGVTASLSISNTSDFIGPYVDDECLLFINGNSVDEPFQCERKYTNIEWMDVVGDGSEELVVTAFVGTYDSFAGEWQNCTRQRILVYLLEGQQPSRVADVEGCVVEEDMFGARIEDYDEDGQVEILAAVPGPGWNGRGPQECTDWDVPCWHEVEYEIIYYEWNGSVFSP